MIHPTEVTIEEFEFNGKIHYSMRYGSIEVNTINQHIHIFAPEELLTDPDFRRRYTVKELANQFISKYMQERYGRNLLNSRNSRRNRNRNLILKRKVGRWNTFDWSKLV